MKEKTIEDIVDEVIWEFENSVLSKIVIRQILTEIDQRSKKYEKP